MTLLILHQAGELLSGSLFELTDHSLDTETLESYTQLVSNALSSEEANASKLVLPQPRDIQAIRRGAHVYLDVTLDVVGDAEKFSLGAAVKAEDLLSRILKSSKKEIKDVRIRWSPVSL